jgi:SAM-dependent methyltransferase
MEPLMSNESRGLPLLARRVANRIARPFGINPFPRAFRNSLTTSGPKNPATLFNEIYHHNYWGSAESRSGVGSETTFTTRYREHLANLLRVRGLRRVFDAPCGDLNWMGQFITEAGTDLDYVGGDISSSVIDDARRRYPELDLRVFDITTDAFPAVDVWHSRDCLFHLPFEAIFSALSSFAGSSIPYALITSHRARLLHRNLDVDFGGFRFLDLERPPLSLPQPIERIPDFSVGMDFPRYVCLWTRGQIGQALDQLKPGH